MKKYLANTDLYSQNIVAVKIKTEKRNYARTLGGFVTKKINRTVYLKMCWFCGSPYESNKLSSFACCKRCSQNITRHRKSGLNPPAKMDSITKEKNIRDLKEKYGY